MERPSLTLYWEDEEVYLHLQEKTTGEYLQLVLQVQQEEAFLLVLLLLLVLVLLLLLLQEEAQHFLLLQQDVCSIHACARACRSIP